MVEIDFQTSEETIAKCEPNPTLIGKSSPRLFNVKFIPDPKGLIVASLKGTNAHRLPAVGVFGLMYRAHALQKRKNMIGTVFATITSTDNS